MTDKKKSSEQSVTAFIGFATGQCGYDGVPVDTWLIADGGKQVAS